MEKPLAAGGSACAFFVGADVLGVCGTAFFEGWVEASCGVVVTEGAAFAPYGAASSMLMMRSNESRHDLL